MNSTAGIFVFAMSLAEFIVSVSCPAVIKSENTVSFVTVLQPGLTPLSHMNSIIPLIFSTLTL